MRVLLLSGIALITLAGAANAADMPVKALKAAPPIDYLWDGFYLGGYYGDAISQSSAKTPNPTVANPIFHRGEMNVNDHQLTAGVTAGYNRKIGSNFLVGVEGDVGYLGFDRTFKEYNDVLAVGEKADWYATLRARAGYLTGPSLLYVTGGAAFVHTTDTFGGVVPPGTPLDAPSASTTTRTGWTAGGGIETKLSRNWSAKTEYLYIDTGTNSFVANPFLSTSNTTFSHNIHVFKSGLNYSFGGPAEGISSLFNAAMLPSNHNWSGFYAGFNAGGGMSNSGVSGKQSPLTPGATITGLNDINGSGFAGGVQAGYNYMITPRYFVGLEGDFGYLGMRQNLYDWFDEQDNFTLKTSWYGTARVRAGVSTGPALLYVTGGAAWVRLADGFGPAVPPGIPLVGDVSWTTRSGWTVGGGTEVALDAHWSAKIETLYIDTGIRGHNDTNPFAFFADFHERFAIARVGLNYKFGNDAVSARY